MYDTLLSKTWDEMMYSDYVFKSNNEKKIIEIKGNQFNPDDKSLIIVYYNVYTHKPMILIQRYIEDIGADTTPEVKGFSKTFIKDEDEYGNDFTEIVYVLRALQDAIE